MISKGVAEDVDHPHVAGLGGEAGGLAKHIVAGQHRGPLGPVGVEGGRAPAQHGPVDHIVVDQRGRVQHLHRRGQRDHLVIAGAVADGAVELRGHEGDGRAHPLAAAVDQIHKGIGQGRKEGGFHPLHLGLHLLQPGPHRGQKLLTALHASGAIRGSRRKRCGGDSRLGRSGSIKDGHGFLNRTQHR